MVESPASERSGGDWMSSKLVELTGVLTLALMVSFLAACEDDISGSQQQMAAIAGETSEVVDSVIEEFFDNNEVLNSLDGLGVSIAGITGSPSIVPFGEPPYGDVWGSRQGMMEVNGALVERFGSRHSGGLFVANIPSQLLGATCIWDLNQQGYVDDPTQTDAPPEGIRFRLYTIDATTFLPAVPLDDIGYVDIIDVSDTLVINDTVVAVAGGDTLLHYGVSGSRSDVNQTFDLDMLGFVSNGTDQLNFSWNATSTTTSFTQSYSVDFGAISVSVDTEYTPTMSTTTWVITDDSNDDEIRVVFGINEQTGDLITGSGVWFNDTQVAEFQGSNFEYSLALSDGSPLSGDDIALLGAATFALEFELFWALEELFLFALSLTGTGVAI
jgi:hypothetical protein